MPDFVDVINVNGERQVVPAEWLNHPVLGAGFRPLNPSGDAQKEKK